MTAEQRRETRIIRCPACQSYYRFAAGPPPPGTRLRCSKCGQVFTLPAADGVARAAAPPSPAPVTAAAHPTGGRGRVLVATDGADFQSLIGEVLSSVGFSLRQARTGDEAWAAIGSWRPHVALLDVALPGVPAFELCDRVRADKRVQGIGLILIASVFQQTRYKRAPTSLYGANDYIEKHHIRDWLPEKVARLLPPGLPDEPAPVKPHGGGPVAPVAPPRVPPAQGKRHGGIDEREEEALIREELHGPTGKERPGLARLRESLRRYARIIISDIALYNQELVERGIREGTFSELLKKEIEEGHRLYLVRVPAAGGGEDYYHEAVRDFIAKRTGAPGAPRPRGGA